MYPADRDFRFKPEEFDRLTFPKYDKNDPPHLVTYTDEQKAAQRTAGVRMKQALHDALAAGDKSLTVPPGVYRFAADEVPVELTGVDGFTLDAYDTEFILEGTKPVMTFRDCRGITVQGLTIDRDPYMHTQFEVLAYDHAEKELTVRFMPGYDPAAPKPAYDIQFFTQEGTWQPHMFVHYSRMEWVDEANRIGRYYGVDLVHEDPAWLVGSLGATILGGEYHCFDFGSCADMSLVDVTNFGASLISWGFKASGTYHFKRVRNVVRPGTNALIAGGWGLIGWDGGGPIVEDCVFGRTNDDGMDVVSWNSIVYRQESENTLLTGTMCQTPYKAGDTVYFYDRLTFNRTGSATVVAVEELPGQEEFEKAQQTAVKLGGYIHLLHKNALCRVTFDRAVTVNPGDTVENYTSFRPDRVVLKNNLFHDVFCRVLIHGTKQALYEGNGFIRTGLAALCIDNEHGVWAEGPRSENVTIRNNVFLDCPWSPYVNHDFQLSAPISVGVTQATVEGYTPCKQQSYSNVVIENNRIINPMYAGILVKNTAGVTIRGNVIDNPVTRRHVPAVFGDRSPAEAYYGAKQDAAIFVYACSDLTVEDNEVIHKGSHCKRDVALIDCVD